MPFVSVTLEKIILGYLDDVALNTSMTIIKNKINDIRKDKLITRELKKYDADLHPILFDKNNHRVIALKICSEKFIPLIINELDKTNHDYTDAEIDTYNSIFLEVHKYVWNNDKFISLLSDKTFKKFITSTILDHEHRLQIVETMVCMLQLDGHSFDKINNIPKPNMLFFGREKELQEIDEIIKEHDVLFITGDPGIGKTEVCAQYACKHISEYEKIIWFDYCGDMIDSIYYGIFSCHGDSYIDKATIVSNFLLSIKNNVLIIIDNYIEESQDFNILDKVKCKVLVNTRCKHASEDFHMYDIRPLTMKESKELLLATTHAENHKWVKNNDQLITDFLNYYGCNTYATILLGNSINEHLPTNNLTLTV